MAKPKTRKLLVEGNEDLAAIAYLIDPHVPWGNNKDEYLVQIDVCGSVDSLLDKHFLSAALKSREARTLGIVIDADDQFPTRWNRIRSTCSAVFPRIPEMLPPAGLVCTNDDGGRLGVWIMPDNSSAGMLETFLRHLVHAANQPLWIFACEAAAEAKRRGAPYRDCHEDKSRIHTFLAWLDPPGQSLGTAVLHRGFNPQSEHALAFVAWFRSLYQV